MHQLRTPTSAVQCRSATLADLRRHEESAQQQQQHFTHQCTNLFCHETAAEHAETDSISKGVAPDDYNKKI